MAVLQFCWRLLSKIAKAPVPDDGENQLKSFSHRLVTVDLKRLELHECRTPCQNPLEKWDLVDAFVCL